MRNTFDIPFTPYIFASAVQLQAPPIDRDDDTPTASLFFLI